MLGARFHIPQTDFIVKAAGGNDLPVGRKGHGPESVLADTVAAKSLEKLVTHFTYFTSTKTVPVPSLCQTWTVHRMHISYVNTSRSSSNSKLIVTRKVASRQTHYGKARRITGILFYMLTYGNSPDAIRSHLQHRKPPQHCGGLRAQNAPVWTRQRNMQV